MDFTYLALGDSYTIGEAVPAEERFPARLASLLQTGEPKIVAVTGWTTDELTAGIEAAQITGTYDLVTLLIGVNNQYRGRPSKNTVPSSPPCSNSLLVLPATSRLT
ncbi:GDSL-type esterase/lipase family protein [Chitinophaga sedimenti]|uniref:GDSL-type esterase/lipase family protein n=1 Tax=Chitinophaga sedimenti TaxID=2033606 RepID=UPI002005DE09|nr:GDSL-type esterase/lipase family protein [Chitinophaga sedimenti]MCK7557025.1 GDSL-type esterase/lipase family protein [Chitinophaga sedimenti]